MSKPGQLLSTCILSNYCCLIGKRELIASRLNPAISYTYARLKSRLKAIADWHSRYGPARSCRFVPTCMVFTRHWQTC